MSRNKLFSDEELEEIQDAATSQSPTHEASMKATKHFDNLAEFANDLDDKIDMAFLQIATAKRKGDIATAKVLYKDMGLDINTLYVLFRNCQRFVGTLSQNRYVKMALKAVKEDEELPEDFFKNHGADDEGDY